MTVKSSEEHNRDEWELTFTKAQVYLALKQSKNRDMESRHRRGRSGAVIGVLIDRLISQ